MQRFSRTDAGNAELFAHLYSSTVRYNHTHKRWMLWRGTHWEADTMNKVHNLTIRAARTRREFADKIEGRDSAEEYRHAVRSEDKRRIECCLSLAQSMDPISTVAADWDCDPWLLGAQNGLINLKTGELLQPDPKYLITKYTAAKFDPAAECPTWKQFLGAIFCGDQTLIEFVQKAIGYSITGVTTAQCFFLLHGEGGNGKSTFLETLGKVLGDYATNTPFSTFELRSKSQIPNDVADLVGARFVSSSESNELDRLNEARIKAMTGGDAMKARHLHKDLFQFNPTFKIWFSMNHLPRIYDSSEGMWRRVRPIAFNADFREKPDEAMPLKLLAEADGILKWCVEGAQKWQAEGLTIPDSVGSEIQSYRESNDPLSEFLKDDCELVADGQVLIRPLWDYYEKWCEEVAEKPVSRSTFNRFLLSKGCTQQRSGKDRARVWQGIRLKDGGQADKADNSFGGLLINSETKGIC